MFISLSILHFIEGEKYLSNVFFRSRTSPSVDFGKYYSVFNEHITFYCYYHCINVDMLVFDGSYDTGGDGDVYSVETSNQQQNA